MSDEVQSWEHWDKERARHLNRFRGGGCAQLTSVFALVALAGTLGGCGILFGLVGEGGVLRGLGAIALSWTPLLVWMGVRDLYQKVIEGQIEKKQLDILLNDPAPDKRCNAVYKLSVINAQGVIPHLESLLQDETLDAKLREYTETTLAKLEEERKEKEA